jgi:hypothetical protein
MPVIPQADKISHGLCLFLCYLYTFTMIPFFALLAPDHEHIYYLIILGGRILWIMTIRFFLSE